MFAVSANDILRLLDELESRIADDLESQRLDFKGPGGSLLCTSSLECRHTRIHRAGRRYGSLTSCSLPTLAFSASLTALCHRREHMTAALTIPSHTPTLRRCGCVPGCVGRVGNPSAVHHRFFSFPLLKLPVTLAISNCCSYSVAVSTPRRNRVASPALSVVAWVLPQ